MAWYGALNLNFNTPTSKDQKILDLVLENVPKPDFAGCVETKVNWIHDMDLHGYGVRQSRSSVSRSNNAFLWNQKTVELAAVRPLRMGVPGADLNHKVQMLTRWLNIADIWTERNELVRVITLHFPPPNLSRLHDEMAKSVRLRINNSMKKGNWILVGDFNMSDGAVRHLIPNASDIASSGFMKVVGGPRMKLEDKVIITTPRTSGWTDHNVVLADFKVVR